MVLLICGTAWDEGLASQGSRGWAGVPEDAVNVRMEEGRASKSASH